MQANTTYTMTPEQRAEWEAGVRALYDTMVHIVVTPTWAKPIDFDETLPTAVEELIAARSNSRPTPRPAAEARRRVAEGRAVT